jgi:hypothetical protein
MEDEQEENGNVIEEDGDFLDPSKDNFAANQSNDVDKILFLMSILRSCTAPNSTCAKRKSYLVVCGMSAKRWMAIQLKRIQSSKNIISA